jgi:methylenetetrahydrofolate dehydrogenase (NADP+)/methenyltetrahydrofolate cyclohydrolase
MYGQILKGTIRRFDFPETKSHYFRKGRLMSKVIDGKAFAAGLRERIAVAVNHINSQYGIKPGLAVVLVGEDPASQVYVRNKGKQTVEVGMDSFEHKLPADTSEEDLLALVDKLNNDAAVNGILVQLPLPDQIDESKVINSINVEKDVDGFHIENVGKLSIGEDSLVPCTPAGCLMLLKDHLGDLSGKSVTIAHSRTRDLPAVCQAADILIAAVGVPELVKGNWVKPGAVVIDVGINRVEGEDGKNRLVGDVDFQAAMEVADAVTPVPGGVGPMTIACLLRNTVIAACRQNGVEVPTAIL